VNPLDAVLLGGSLLPVGLWGLYHWGGASTGSLLLAFQVGLNLPHYFQTYALTYFDPEVRRREAWRLGAALAAALAFPLGAILAGPRALQITLAFIAFWAFLHITQQTRGLAGLYLRRGGDTGGELRRPLLAFLGLSTAAVVAWRVTRFGLTLSGQPLPSANLAWAALSLASVLALGLSLMKLTRARLPALTLAVLHTGAMALSMSVADLSLALALATSWHALQYLGLTFAVQRRRSEALLWPRLARHEAAGFFFVAMLFGLAAAGLGAALPRPWGQAIYLPLLMMHYLNDAWLWRPDRNPDARVWLSPLLSPRT
jgi:hypothetical protein